jgi:Tol biopolymer transport system component
MGDERLRRDLRVVDTAATPRPEFVEELYGRLLTETSGAAQRRGAGRAASSRRHGSIGGLTLVAAAILVGSTIVGLMLLGVGSARIQPSDPKAKTSHVAVSSIAFLTPDPSVSGIDALDTPGRLVFERHKQGELPQLRTLAAQRASEPFAPDVPGTQIGPSWSPDGSYLVFAAAPVEAPAAWRIWRVDATGGSPVLISVDCGTTRCIGESEPAHAMDGSRIAFVRTSAGAGGTRGTSLIAIRDLVSGTVTELETTRTAASQRLRKPTWAPDGSSIAYSTETVTTEGVFEKSSIWIVEAEGGRPRRLTSDELIAGDAAWSPRGERILFGTFPIRSVWSQYAREVDGTHLYEVAPDGSALRQLPLQGPVGAASWTADGRQILFTSIVNAGTWSPGATWLMALDAEVTTLRTITTGNNCCSWYSVQQPTP